MNGIGPTTKGVWAKNWGCLLTCCVALIAVATLAVYPASRTLQRMRSRRVALEEEIKEQALLQPLYADLLARSQASASEALAPEPRKSLSKEQITDIPAMFEAMAQKSSLRLAAAVPHVKSGPDGKRLLRVEVVTSGRLLDFREFLLELTAAPYFEHLAKIRVRKALGEEELELEAWLAVE